ncbi:MAG TPA: MFS transporter [Burkholderiales bacterium]|nr:MFS transporter [Burkholderiales bacterium]
MPSAAPVSTAERQYPYWRRNLQVLPFSMMLASLGFGLAWPFLPLMVRALGVEQNLETWVGNMVLVFYVVSFVMNPIWGSIADHYGRKIMVLRATLGMGISMALTAFAPTPLAFAFLLMFVGVFNGASSASMALIVANTPPPRIGRALSFVQTGSLIGQTMGPAVGALLASMIERQHSLYWVSGGFMIVAGILVATLVHEVKQLAPGRWRLQWIGPLRELLAVPRMGPLFMLSFLFSALWFGNVPVMSLFALDLLSAAPPSIGTEAAWLGAVALGLGISGAIAMPIWGRVLDRHDPARVLAFATAAAALTQVPLVFLQTPFALVLARLAFGLSAAAMQPAIIRLLKDHSPPGMDARAISYASSFQFIAMGLAPFAAGLIGPAFGLRTYFALTVVLTVAGLVLWRRSGRA